MSRTLSVVLCVPIYHSKSYRRSMQTICIILQRICAVLTRRSVSQLRVAQTSTPRHLLNKGQSAENVPANEAASIRSTGNETISKPPSVNSAAETQKSQSARVSSHRKSLLWAANLISAAATEVLPGRFSLRLKRQRWQRPCHA